MKTLISVISVAILMLGLGSPISSEASTLTLTVLPDPHRTVYGSVGALDPCPKPRNKRLYRDLAAAIKCARNGDEINVKPGLYLEPETVTIAIDKRLRIYGSGYWNRSSPPTLRTSNGRASNVIVNARFDVLANVEIQGLTIVGRGEAFDGGILQTLEPGVTALIKDSILTNGRAVDGAAIRVESGTNVVLVRSTVTGGVAEYSGGAVSNDGRLVLRDSVITANSAVFGGGVYNRGELLLDDSSITANTATSSGGGIFNDGGVVKYASSTSHITLNVPSDCEGCVFLPPNWPDRPSE